MLQSHLQFTVSQPKRSASGVESWSPSPFCLWIGLELFIVCHFEEGKFCLIGCEEKNVVQIKISAGTQIVNYQNWTDLVLHLFLAYINISYSTWPSYININRQFHLVYFHSPKQALNIAFTYQHHMPVTCSHHAESTSHRPPNSLQAHSSEKKNILFNIYHIRLVYLFCLYSYSSKLHVSNKSGRHFQFY